VPQLNKAEPDPDTTRVSPTVATGRAYQATCALAPKPGGRSEPISPVRVAHCKENEGEDTRQEPNQMFPKLLNELIFEAGFFMESVERRSLTPLRTLGHIKGEPHSHFHRSQAQNPSRYSRFIIAPLSSPLSCTDPQTTLVKPCRHHWT
jgi:hypothetical protein